MKKLAFQLCWFGAPRLRNCKRFIWNVISLAVSLTEKYVNIKDKLNIAVTPDYNKKCFNFDFIIIFDTYFFRMLKISKRAKQLYERYNANLKNGGAKENG